MGKNIKKNKKMVVIVLIIILVALVVITLVVTNVFNRKNIVLLTYDGVIHDGGYNELIWSGLKKLKYKANISYIECTGDESFLSTLNDISKKNVDLIIASEGTAANAIYDAANIEGNNTSYIAVDTEYINTLPNLCSVSFNSYEASFLAGYIAGRKTSTNTVGFVGGKNEETINNFEKGYIAGVKYANASCNIISTYTESYTDVEAGKKAANTLFTVNVDIIFHASGKCGEGVIATAAEKGKLAIGVDKDQSYLAKGTVISSVIKNVDKAVYNLANDFINDKEIFDKSYVYGLSDGSVGVIKDSSTLDKGLIKELNELEEKITNGGLDLKRIVFEGKYYQ